MRCYGHVLGEDSGYCERRGRKYVEEEAVREGKVKRKAGLMKAEASKYILGDEMVF